MGAAGELVEEAFRIEERGVDWRSGLAGALAAAGPLAIGLALDDTVAGLTAAIGGLNTALCVPRAGLRARLWWGVLAAVGGLVALALADLAQPHTALLVLIALLFCGGCAFGRAAGAVGALLGFATSAVFTVLAGVPADPAPLDERLLWFALGALGALVLMVAARHGPEPSAHVARDSWRALRDGVRHDRALRAHALRLGVSVAAGTLLYRAIDLPHGYWVALTTLAIMQPGEHATRVRAVQRAAGTLGGAAVIVAITLVTDARAALAACVAAAAFWLYALDERGYFWLVVMLTPTVLLMLSVIDFQGDDIALERVANSALGIAIGLVIGEAAWRLVPLRAPTAPDGRSSPSRRRAPRSRSG